MRGALDPLFDLAAMRRYAAPGQCLESRLSGKRGTIGIIGVDIPTTRKVALTAMHVLPGIVEYPSPSHPDEILFESPCVNGPRPIVGRLLRGTRSGVDAAAIEIDDDQDFSNFLPGIGKVEFWKPVDPAQRVRMVGAVSGKQHGRIVATDVPVPGWKLTSAMVVEIAAVPGDSGAPLVDENGRLIGMLVGGTSTRQLFCPIELVFAQLKCTLFKD